MFSAVLGFWDLFWIWFLVVIILDVGEGRHRSPGEAVGDPDGRDSQARVTAAAPVQQPQSAPQAGRDVCPTPTADLFC